MSSSTKSKSKTTFKFIQGNRACAEAALAAGMRFFAGYPITPSTEIPEYLSIELPKVGGRFIQMEDEIASMGATLGASLTGVKSMTATSGPGFSLKQELIGYGCISEIPCVIVSVQRGGPSTGQPTFPSQGDVMQARWGTHGDHPAIVLTPSSVKEMYDLTIKAFNFSEQLRTPVILLPDEVVAHMREKIEIPAQEELEITDRVRPSCSPENYKPYAANSLSDIPPMADMGDGYRHNVTGLIHNELGFPTTDGTVTEFLIRRLGQKIESRRKEIMIYSTYKLEDAEIVLFSYGSVARSCLQAMSILRQDGLKVGVINVNTLWPFCVEALSEIPSSVKNIIVAEMNLGQIIQEVQRNYSGTAKIKGVNVVDGKIINPSKIIEVIRSK